MDYLKRDIRDALQIKEKIVKAIDCLKCEKFEEGEINLRIETARNVLILINQDVYGMINEWEEEARVKDLVDDK